MTYRVLIVSALLALCILITEAISLSDANANPSIAQCAQRANVQEDDPCFAWSTRGNLARGLYVKSHAPNDFRDYALEVGAKRLPWGAYLVDAPAFCRLSRAHGIDWTRSPHLRGDEFARMHGCDGRYYAQSAR